MIRKVDILKFLIFGYFIIAFFEVVSEYFAYTPFICSLKPLIPLLLVVTDDSPLSRFTIVKLVALGPRLIVKIDILGL